MGARSYGGYSYGGPGADDLELLEMMAGSGAGSMGSSPIQGGFGYGRGY
jgi:hypothetical protein